MDSWMFFYHENKRLAYLRSVIEFLNETINRNMIEPTDINVTKAWKKKSYRIHDMVIDPICFCQVKKTACMAFGESHLSKGKNWRWSVRKSTTNMTTIRKSNYFTSELSLQYSCAIVDSVLLMLSFHVLHMLDLEYCVACFHSFQLRWWDSRTVHLPWCFYLSSATTWSSQCGCTRDRKSVV